MASSKGMYLQERLLSREGGNASDLLLCSKDSGISTLEGTTQIFLYNFVYLYIIRMTEIISDGVNLILATSVLISANELSAYSDIF
jgi:hypothetical protein